MRFRFLTLLLGVVFIIVSSASADGKLLRGEKWKKFNPEGKKADFYISLDGNDEWSGKLTAPNANKTDGPFASIERAQEAVRELKEKIFKPKVEPVEKRYIGSPHIFGEGKDILVFIREGYYELERPLQFTPQDGGERCETDLPSGAFEYHKLKDYYVTYAAFPGEKAVISGGIRINSWEKKDKFWSSNFEKSEVKNLLINGKIQTLARIPNEGYYTPAEVPTSKQSFKFNPGDLKQWDSIEDNRIIMLLRWHTGVNSVERIDEKRHTVYLKEPQNGIVVIPPRYYIENIKDLLDAPGEWYYDKETEELLLIIK